MPDTPKKSKRFNKDKPEIGYILEFPESLKDLARTMEFGASKYGRGNFKLGGRPDHEYIDSAMRHLQAIHKAITTGDDEFWYDAEGKFNHIGAVLFNIMCLRDFNHPDLESKEPEPLLSDEDLDSKEPGPLQDSEIVISLNKAESLYDQLHPGTLFPSIGKDDS